MIMRALWRSIGGGILVGALAMGAIGCSTTPSASPPVTNAPAAPSPTITTYTLNGYIAMPTISDQYVATGAAGSACYAVGPFQDINLGTQVFVRDESSNIIGLAELQSGTVQAGTLDCTWPFSVTGVPQATIYQVSVGHRQGPSYSFQELVTDNWMVALHLTP